MEATLEHRDASEGWEDVLQLLNLEVDCATPVRFLYRP